MSSYLLLCFSNVQVKSLFFTDETACDYKAWPNLSYYIYEVYTGSNTNISQLG